MNYKSLLIPVLAATLTAGLVRYYWPRVETKTVTQTQIVVRTDIHTVTRTVEHPDGTKEVVVDTTDHSVANTTAKSSKLTASVPNWHISASANRSLANPLLIYGLQADRRILGPVFVGLRLDTVGQAGISLGMEF